jgi:hypothetical protein
MLRQTFSGLECEVLRRPEIYNVTTQRALVWPDRNSTDFWKYGLTQTVERSFTRIGSGNTAKLIFYAQYRPRLDNQEVSRQTVIIDPSSKPDAQVLKIYSHRDDTSSDDTTYIQMHLILNSSDVVVFDHGLHFLEEQSAMLNTAMDALLPALLHGIRHSRSKLVAWRETSAQHFATPRGYWKPENLVNQSHCVPHEKETGGFQLPIMARACDRANMTLLNAFREDFFAGMLPVHDNEIILLPFYNFSRELHYNHPSECTHYCSTPYLWLSTWRGLRLALERLLTNG